MKKISIQAALVAMLLMLVGCVTPQPAVPPNVTWHPESGVDGLMEGVVINMERYPSGSLRTVFFKGTGAQYRQPIEWSISWFEASGKKIPGISDRYRRATLNPNVPFHFEAPAPVDYAARAEIHIRKSFTR